MQRTELSVFCLVGALVLPVVPALAGVPQVIPFQGLLQSADGVPVPDGSHTLRFRLFNGPDGDQQIRNEEHLVTGDTIVLLHAPIVPDSEIVRKSGSLVAYVRGLAYTIDYDQGVITRMNAHAIPDGTKVEVTYRWVPETFWTETQTVQTARGMFSTLLGERVSLPANLLTENTWLEVAVADAVTPEVLAPRQRLASVPYALKVGSLDEASGGDIQGPVNASGWVSGHGSVVSFSGRVMVVPGLLGYGASDGVYDAPGVRAVAAEDGTGLALEVLGGARITGGLETSGISAAGPVSATSLVAGPIVASNVVASGNVTVSGYIAGRGLLKPDFDSGLQVMESINPYEAVFLPDSLGNDIGSWLVEVTYEEIATNPDGSVTHTVFNSDKYLEWYAYVTLKNAVASRREVLVIRSGATETMGDIRYRVRVWRPH